MSTTKSIVELLAERPAIDNSAAFDRLWDIFGALRKKLDARFKLELDPSTTGLQPYEGLAGSGANGFLSAWVGDGLDWFVHSWIGNPRMSFCNMHLTLWLGPHTRVPHLAFALATVPDVFFYMDYIPRVEPALNPEYLDKYYQPSNASYLEFLDNPAMTPFVSKSAYVRESLSSTALCTTCKADDANFSRIEAVAHEMLDRWIGWLDAGDPVPPGERDALAARDLKFRRTIAERDPANVIGERLFGKPLTDRLVRTLWGGDRVIPRPR